MLWTWCSFQGDCVKYFVYSLSLFHKTTCIQFKYISLVLIVNLFFIPWLLKRADLRWNRKLEDMEQLKKLQDELLEAASK